MAGRQGSSFVSFNSFDKKKALNEINSSTRNEQREMNFFLFPPPVVTHLNDAQLLQRMNFHHFPSCFIPAYYSIRIKKIQSTGNLSLCFSPLLPNAHSSYSKFQYSNFLFPFF